jgi:inner membrane protein
MDSLTHITLGACTGELLLGKKLGKKAMLFGAITANIPDVDTIPGLFMRGDEALLFHRSITHSLFFALLFGLLLAFVAKKAKLNAGYWQVAFFFCFELALHDLLDTCTSYGTGLLEPFSHHRFSFHLLYVVDPLFTISLLCATIYLLFARSGRATWAAIGIAISTIYLCVAVYCKSRIAEPYSTPAPFTTLLWFCITKTDKGYYTAYRSVFDQEKAPYSYYPQNDALLKQPEPYLKTFADGYYTISDTNGKLHFNVLRFGQIQGWVNKNAPFALSYPVPQTGNENMIVQKGRLTGWNSRSVKVYLKRIAGVQP